MENTMSKNEMIEKALRSYPKGSFITIIAESGLSNMRKTNNPYVGRVRKITMYKRIGIARSYENAVNNRIEAIGGERNFAAQKPSGKHHIDAYILAADKDESKHYAALFTNRNTIFDSVYLVDNRLATPTEVKEIESFIPEHKESARQSEAGIAAEDQVKMFTPLIENIISVGVTYNSLAASIAEVVA